MQIQQIPIFDNGTEINIEKSGRGEKLLKKADRYIRKGVTASTYRKEAYRVRSLLPILKQLHPGKLRSIKPGHFKKAVDLLLRSNTKNGH